MPFMPDSCALLRTDEHITGYGLEEAVRRV